MIAHNPAGSQIAGGVTPADYAFRKVAERRFVLDAELPYDGAFLPAARYEIDVKGPGASIDFAERATGRRILSVPAPATVAPPFSFSLILTGLGRIATYVRKDGRVTLDRTLACPDGFNPRLRVNLGNAVSNARVTLSAGIGQADVRFVTEGRSHAPYVEDDRYYFTFSARSFGSYLGVASFTPEAFDVRFEGVILFDYGDGELRNDVAADLFHDTATGEWRAFVSNFSTGGDALSGRAKGGINVAWCTTSPLHGFSVMSAKSLDLEGMNEDPDGYYDAEAGMWRLFVSEFTPGRIRAALLESEHWDGTYRRIAGPVAEDSTGTTLVRCGGKTWAIFGSADRACYVRTYPDLEPVGHLSFDHPPWPAGKSDNWAEGRVWPAFAETPGGAMLLTMDRDNFPGMPKPNWTYGKLHFYRAGPVNRQSPIVT
jgi:hypothetical protein